MTTVSSRPAGAFLLAVRPAARAWCRCTRQPKACPWLPPSADGCGIPKHCSKGSIGARWAALIVYNFTKLALMEKSTTV